MGSAHRGGGTPPSEGGVPPGRWEAVGRLPTPSHRPGGTGALLAGGRASEAFRHSPTNTVHLDNHYNKYHHHNINNNKPNNNLNNDLSGCGLLSLSRNNLLHFQVKHSSHSFKLPCNVVVKQWGIRIFIEFPLILIILNKVVYYSFALIF